MHRVVYQESYEQWSMEWWTKVPLHLNLLLKVYYRLARSCSSLAPSFTRWVALNIMIENIY